VEELGLNEMIIAVDYFYQKLLVHFGYVLDTESDTLFPAGSRIYSYQRKPWPNTQFIHRSGTAFVEILQENQGFLWVKNRLLLANQSAVKYSTSNSTSVSPDKLFERLQTFCSNESELRHFWDECTKEVLTLANSLPSGSIIE
jgi:DEP domain-containing protein 5